MLGGISLTYGNALVSTPAAVLIPRLKSRCEADFQEVVFGSIALVISAGITIIVAAGLWLATGQMVEAIAGGTFSGLWTLRNHVRCVMFARHAIVAATWSDFSYSASGVLLIGAALWLVPDLPQLTGVLLALTLANIVAISVALRAQGRPARVSFSKHIWRRYRAIWSDIAWSLFGTTTWAIQGQGRRAALWNEGSIWFWRAAETGRSWNAPRN